MKSLADIKRRLHIGGRLTCTKNTKNPKAEGPRTIARVQGNSIACNIPGDDRLFWTNFPKAKDVRIVDADTFRFHLWGDEHYTELRFEQERV